MRRFELLIGRALSDRLTVAIIATLELNTLRTYRMSLSVLPLAKTDYFITLYPLKLHDTSLEVMEPPVVVNGR